MKRHDLISSGILFGFGLLILLYAPEFGLGRLNSPGSGFMPFLSGLVICGFSATNFFQALQKKATPSEKIWDKVNFRKLIWVMLILCAYAILLERTGFIIDTFLLILILMRYVGSEPWLKSILGAVLSSILTYLLFETWLSAQLPRGIFGF